MNRTLQYKELTKLVTMTRTREYIPSFLTRRSDMNPPTSTLKLPPTRGIQDMYLPMSSFVWPIDWKYGCVLYANT